MLSMVKLKTRFLPQVLQTQTFRNTGILFGSEPHLGGGWAPRNRRTIHWVVIDPRKHIMSIWEKNTQDFLESALALGASCFSNGSFNKYMSGGGFNAHSINFGFELAKAANSTASVGLQLLAALTPNSLASLRMPMLLQAVQAEQMNKVIEGMQDFNYTSLNPEGFILGKNVAQRTDQSRPSAAYFERRGGREFKHYAIGAGDPKTDTAAEAIGGLFHAIDNYKNVHPKEINMDNGLGLWGLAPLNVKAIAKEDPEFAEGAAAYDGSEILGKLDGVIVGLFGWEYFLELIDVLIGIGTRDAVRIDSSDSILLGHHKTFILGGPDDMPRSKRMYNRWGFQFQAG